MLCANPKCRAPLKAHYWGEGYCCGECMSVCMSKGESMTECLHRPSTGEVICECADEVDAMLEAFDIDPRLPRIIYLRRKKQTLRAIGAACGIDERTCRRILARAAPNLRRRCGLR